MIECFDEEKGNQLRIPQYSEKAEEKYQQPTSAPNGNFQSLFKVFLAVDKINVYWIRSNKQRADKN